MDYFEIIRDERHGSPRKQIRGPPSTTRLSHRSAAHIAWMCVIPFACFLIEAKTTLGKFQNSRDTWVRRKPMRLSPVVANRPNAWPKFDQGFSRPLRGVVDRTINGTCRSLHDASAVALTLSCPEPLVSCSKPVDESSICYFHSLDRNVMPMEYRASKRVPVRGRLRLGWASHHIMHTDARGWRDSRSPAVFLR